MSSADETLVLTPGETLAQFQIRHQLGKGGMGTVYYAEDTKLHRTVALKVLSSEVAEKPDLKRRFLREGRLAAALTHPSIATVYEVNEINGRVFIAMEYVEGRTLGLMLKDGPLKVDEALRIAREIARGLAKAHDSDVIHRDLKPDNVMVGTDVVKILDFGVAKSLVTNANIGVTDVKTQHGSLVGTPAYMSPEQASGKDVDRRTDVFSFGVLLYELLTGARPFEGDTWQELIIAINRDVAPPPSAKNPMVTPDVDAIILRCLSKKPDDRYASCREVFDDLDQLAKNSGTFTALPTPEPGSLQLPEVHPGARTTSATSLSNLSAPPNPSQSGKTLLIAAGIGLGLMLLVGWRISSSGNEGDVEATGQAQPAAAQPEEAPLEPESAPTSDASDEPEPQASAPDPIASATPSASAPPTTASTAPSLPPTQTAPPVQTAPPSSPPTNPILGF